jgi:class 3 adenylate cyclase
VEGPGVRYAKCDGRHIGYQVTGDGPIDLLALNSGCHVWVDRENEPHWRRFDEQLASFSRLIRFDPSGIGLSDPPPGGSMPTIELWMQDALSVLDDVGSLSASVFAVGEGGSLSIMLAAAHPERVSSLILFHCAARLLEDVEYRGLPKQVLETFIDAVTDPTFDGDAIDDLEMLAPTLRNDVEFQRWWQRAGERSASPAIARAIDEVVLYADTRSLLPLVAAPTLVLNRRNSIAYPISVSRYLAENIGNARYVEIPGRDFLPHVGDVERVLGEVEEFVVGTRGARDVERVLATILFTDIANSTRTLAESDDKHWRELLDNHDQSAKRQIVRFGGQMIKSTGDGILATFNGPAQAIRCGMAMRDDALRLGVDIRVGVHAGEIERREHDIAGIGVHIAARVLVCADPGEVLVSRTVTDLVAGSGMTFVDKGEHELKGVPGNWQLFSVRDDPYRPTA